MKIRPLFWVFVFVSVVSGVLYSSRMARGSHVPLKSRSVARLPIERNEPIRIRAVRVNAVRVAHRQEFLAEDDWLRRVSVTIMNRTNKNIIFAAANVQFPRPP